MKMSGILNKFLENSKDKSKKSLIRLGKIERINKVPIFTIRTIFVKFGPMFFFIPKLKKKPRQKEVQFKEVIAYVGTLT